MIRHNYYRGLPQNTLVKTRHGYGHKTKCVDGDCHKVCIDTTGDWHEAKGGIDTYVIHDASPTLHCDALEDGKHCESEVIEVGDAAVRSGPVPGAHPSTFSGAFEALAARPRIFHRDETCEQHTCKAAQSLMGMVWWDRGSITSHLFIFKTVKYSLPDECGTICSEKKR